MNDSTPDDDRTIDADPAALDRIRELAAAAETGATDPPPARPTGDRHPNDRDPNDRGPNDRDPDDGPAGDHTIDADPATLDHLRRLAGEHDPGDDRTIDADPAALDQLRRRAHDAGGPRPSGASRPMPRQPIPEVATPPPVRPSRPVTTTEPWRPPARSMRPERIVDAPADHGARWRLVSIVLAVVLLVTIGWLVFGGSDQPIDESPPEPAPSTVPGAATTPSSNPATNPSTSSGGTVDGDG
jgi:hypothetical protein